MNSFFKTAATVISLAANDFKSKYAGSVLGSVWAIAEPAALVLVYWFAYTVAFGGGDVNGIPYFLYLSAGMVPWCFISGGLTGISSCFRDYSYLIKKTYFNKKLLPYIRLFSALFSHIVFCFLIVVICIFCGSDLSKIYLLPAVFLLSAVFVLSLGKILAVLCAGIKDVQNAVSVVLNIAFWITPIFWNGADIPLKYSAVVRFNPAALICDSYRNVLLFGRYPELSAVIRICAISAVLFLVGSLIERKLLPNISDRL